ncbi:hypothetical protein JCM14076_22970 [Methylosoma difficile]
MSNPATTIILPTKDDPRWQAGLARDITADGRFYYSVKTTGVYCRPCWAQPKQNLVSPTYARRDFRKAKRNFAGNKSTDSVL